MGYKYTLHMLFTQGMLLLLECIHYVIGSPSCSLYFHFNIKIYFNIVGEMASFVVIIYAPVIAVAAFLLLLNLFALIVLFIGMRLVCT